MAVLRSLRLGLNALFAPQTCGLCDHWVLNPRLIPLCEVCRAGLSPISGTVCHYCGTPLPGCLIDSLARCSNCRDHPPVPVNLRSWGLYEGDLRELIQLYKFGLLRHLSWPLSKLLCQGLETGFSDLEFDWLVPVPSHPSRARDRGFDAVGLLAQRLSDQTGIPVFSGASRSKMTAPQFGLGREERILNLKGAFQIDGQTRLQRRILIVDDILTTGTTILELASAIETSGRTETIAALTIARTPLSMGSGFWILGSGLARSLPFAPVYARRTGRLPQGSRPEGRKETPPPKETKEAGAEATAWRPQPAGALEP